MTGSAAITVFSRRLLPLLALAGAAASAAPAPDAAAQLRALEAADIRVARIAFALQSQGAPLCPVRGAASGMTLHHLHQYGRAHREAARRLWSLSDAVTVLAVAPGSPAARAGLAPGDRLLAIDGTPVARDGLAAVRAASLRLSSLGEAPYRLVIERNGRERDLLLRPVPACRSRVQIAPGRRARAWSDGDLATITTPLLRFARDDDELAFILGHEIAHNALGHGGGSHGRRGRKAREVAADQLAIRLMSAAGYDHRVVPAFLRRLYQGPAAAPLGRGGHLSLRERLRQFPPQVGARK